MKSVAILGATGHIGTALAHALINDHSPYDVYLFSRSKDKLESLKNILSVNLASKSTVHYKTLEKFTMYNYDVVINATGISDLLSLQNMQKDIVRMTEEMDHFIMEYLSNHLQTICIMMSSGAVYGAPLTLDSAILASDYYAFAKKESEARHRRAKKLSIVDVRVFSFFSRFIDIHSHFFMSEIARSLMEKKTFVTNSDDIVRDYISAKDLLRLIKKIIEKGTINDFFDAYSKEPISKFKLLEFLKRNNGLIYEVEESNVAKNGISGSIYIPKERKAEGVGYCPEYSSLESIVQELNAMKL